MIKYVAEFKSRGLTNMSLIPRTEATNIYSVCQTIHKPTTVEYSIVCHFYNIEELNLVVAGSNRLNVYRIVQDKKLISSNGDSKSNCTILEQLQSFELYGTIASLDKIKLGSRHRYERDSLVMSFYDAKLSVVQYNPQNHDLKSVSMHYFEDDLRDGAVTSGINRPIARVDPENRCIAMVCYGKHIVVIPVDKDEEKDLEHELYDTSPSTSSDDDSLSYGEDDDHEPASKRRKVVGQVVNLKRAPNPIAYVSNTNFNTSAAEDNDMTKHPVLPSYIIDLKEESCGEKIENIVDIQFLHNYNNPTLVLLFEASRTWSGRVAMKQDTFSMVALSMNVHQRLHPIIWTVNNLPYDSLRILPVPKPIGGLLVIACNEIIYLNQSIPPFGMSLNCFSKESSNFPLDNIEELLVPNNNTNHLETKPNIDTSMHSNSSSNSISNAENGCENSNSSEDTADDETNQVDATKENDDRHYLNISLDLSQSVFLDYNKILFILKDGNVHLVTLFNDDMRSIKKFNFDFIATTVQPNCLTLCDDNLLFIGSHVGDSVLAMIVGDFKDSKQIDDIYNISGYDVEYQNSHEEHKSNISLIEQCKLISTSASGRICYGESTNISENLPHDQKDPYVELITASGYNKGGSICVLQRTIKPSVEDTYEINSCDDLWTLKPKTGDSDDDSKARLLMNRRDETYLYSTKGVLEELKRGESDFETTVPTVLAANIGTDNLSIQLTSSCARLLSDDKLIHSIEFESQIVDACMSDSYIIALTNDNLLYHIQLICNQENCNQHDTPSHNEIESRKYSLSYKDIGNLMSGEIVSMTLYKDYSYFFAHNESPNNNSSNHDNVETNHQNSISDNDNKSMAPTYWLLLVDDRGVLEIFHVPNFTQVYSVDNFPSHPNVLQDNIKLFVRDVDQGLAKTKEILMIGMGYGRKRPILFVRSEKELSIYEAYPFNDYDLGNHLKIRFKKIYSMLLITLFGQDGIASNEIEQQQNEQLAITQGRNHHRRRHNQHSARQKLPDLCDIFKKKRHWLRHFKGIGHYDGVFLQGFRPHWMIMGDTGCFRLHPMNVDGAIYAFSHFVNDKFIYYTQNRELRVASLPTHLDLSLQWPMKKIPIGETVHFVNYHVERKIYCVVTSTPVACTKIMKVGNEPDTMKIEDLKSDSGYIPPMTERFRLRLYDPHNWEQIPDCEIEFDEWEQVTCVKNVSLASEGTTSGLKGYIALSTNYCYGEDVPNRGRIFILDLIEVVPEPDRPLTKNKIKKVYCQEQKGPVTTLSHICGLLMSAVGQKIYLWQLKEEQLDGVAFIDTQIYIHCAASVKNLILVSDVCKSISLLRYQQETRTLSMVCRDTRPLEVFACAFVVDNHLLNFVVSDSEKNLIIYAHDPEHEESGGGIRLLRRADYHLGAHVTSFCRLRAKVPSVYPANSQDALKCRRKQLTMFCSVDGAVHYIYPISEEVYKQLNRLQSELTMALPHVAGLNPKAWRCIKQARPSIANPCKLIIDGDLIDRFRSLSSKERNDLARKVGSTTDKILADLQCIQEATMYF